MDSDHIGINRNVCFAGRNRAGNGFRIRRWAQGAPTGVRLCRPCFVPAINSATTFPALSLDYHKAPPHSGGSRRAELAYPLVNETRVSPEKPNARAAAGLTSMMPPRTNGPRSEIRTTTLRPFFKLVTRTCVPNGRRRCDAVKALGFKRSPLAVFAPRMAITVTVTVHRGDPQFCLSTTRGHDAKKKMKATAKVVPFITVSIVVWGGPPWVRLRPDMGNRGTFRGRVNFYAKNAAVVRPRCPVPGTDIGKRQQIRGRHAHPL